MIWLWNRVKEPSTWAGFAAVLAVLSHTAAAISANMTKAGIVSAIAAGAVAMVSSEGK